MKCLFPFLVSSDRGQKKKKSVSKQYTVLSAKLFVRFYKVHLLSLRQKFRIAAGLSRGCDPTWCSLALWVYLVPNHHDWSCPFFPTDQQGLLPCAVHSCRPTLIQASTTSSAWPARGAEWHLLMMCKTACLVQASEGLLATETVKWCSSTLRSTRPLVLFSFSASFLKTLEGFCEVLPPSSLSHSGRSGRERKYAILKRKKTALKKRKYAEPSMELFLLS